MTDSAETQVIAWVSQQMAEADSGHGLDHVRRVVINAQTIGAAEGADMRIVVPAAWLHDCVIVPKNSPRRSQASRLAAAKAAEYLSSIQFSQELIPAIVHCIAAHSFSAGIPCESLEARVVQDSDRLEALGAIGVARCLMTGGAMRQRLYHPHDPFPIDRTPEDSVQSIDHLFAKLLTLADTMQTATGKTMARQRTGFMVDFLRQLAREIHIDPQQLQSAIDKVCQ
jgi:uncharacterized protein